MCNYILHMHRAILQACTTLLASIHCLSFLATFSHTLDNIYGRPA